MIIRDATIEDIPFIVKEGSKFLTLHPANLQKDFDINHLLSLADNFIQNHVILIAEESNERLGMIAGLISPNPFNPNYIGLQEFIWWVREESRHTSAAIKLYKAFEKKARLLEVDFISMVSTSYTPTLEKLYKKDNFIPVETAYIKEL